jgi:MFS family permease
LSDKFGPQTTADCRGPDFCRHFAGQRAGPLIFVFIAWRIFGGVAIGLASNLSPMYIAEVAPAQMRGKLVSINQLTIVIGILLAQYINWFLVRDLPAGATDEFIRNSWFGQQGWRWMFGLTAAPALLFFSACFSCRKARAGWRKMARPNAPRILTKIGGAGIMRTRPSAKSIHAGQREIQHVRFADLLEPKMRKVLVLGRGAGGVPAMVRHQRHFQLRRGDFPRGRLRHFQRA